MDYFSLRESIIIDYNPWALGAAKFLHDFFYAICRVKNLWTASFCNFTRERGGKLEKSRVSKSNFWLVKP